MKQEYLSYSDIIDDNIFKKNSYVNGQYSTFLTRINFSHAQFEIFNIPYFLDDSNFLQRFDEIERVLTYFHELTHYIQNWSTTNGILEFFILYSIGDL
ncbi:hypothetical protein U27_06592 [Candidatus Vecturithrix granuli]|uniref:Uncharacterized protein n=1 Tax=Vecturithrix granuli TaxID=1499967 RepID=A0A081C4V2_VECG1|nr:hypothetical protein U27_06592 [Candidatus Vecturithrix granuli]